MTVAPRKHADGRLLYGTPYTGWMRFFDGRGWRQCGTRRALTEEEANVLNMFCMVSVLGNA
jgi:hypothetical protein